MEEIPSKNPHAAAPTWTVADDISSEEKASLLSLIHVLKLYCAIYVFFYLEVILHRQVLVLGE